MGLIENPGEILKYKVAILHQGFIPQYRVKFYELLASETDTHYVVFHGSPSPDQGHRAFNETPIFSNVKVRNYEFSLRGISVIYQPVVLQVLRGSFDAIILGHELKYFSNLLIFCLCKVMGKPVLWWGHGFHINRSRFSSSGYLAPIVAAVKNFFARTADMYLVYTDGGAKRLLHSGVPAAKIGVVRNTIDMTEQVYMHEKYSNTEVDRIRKEFHLRSTSTVFLYIGRIIKEKCVEELLYLVKDLNATNMCRRFVEAVVIGSGPELDRVRQIGEGIDGCHIMGRIDEEDIVARYMRISAGFVIPGKVGLAVNYAFAHGVPVITRQHAYHAPEVEYIKSDENGLIVDGDFKTFVRTVAEYVNSTEAQRRLATGALKTRDLLSLDVMVKAFDESAREAIKQKRGAYAGSSKARID